MSSSSRPRYCGILTAGLLALAWPASALQPNEAPDLTVPTEGYTYFNRPGASIEEHAAAVRRCIGIADQALTGAMLGMRRVDPAHSTLARSRVFAIIENCMVVSGWRVISVPEREGRALAELSQSELVAALSENIGAVSPPHQIVREFENEALARETIIDGWDRQRSGSSYFLGLGLAGQEAPISRSPTPPQSTPPRGSALSHGPLQLGDLPVVPPEAAVVALEIVGSDQDHAYAFELVQPPGSELTSVMRRTDPVVSFSAARRFSQISNSSGTGSILFFVVTPGDWRVAGRMTELGGRMMDFCLGAPRFAIAAGETVFLGTFDMSGALLAPSFESRPDAITSALGPGRSTAARTAAWQNGAAVSCERAIYTYSLEFPRMQPVSEAPDNRQQVTD